MAGLVSRPPAPLRHADGFLRKDHFQVSYVTTDLDRACTIIRDRYGIKEFKFLEGSMPDGGYIKVAFAWAGGTLYEIIHAKGPKTEFYNSRLPADGFGIRFHHLGFLVHDRDSWRALEKEFEEKSWPIVAKSVNPGFMDAYYIEAPELGHYLEFIYPEKQGIEFFEAVPSS